MCCGSGALGAALAAAAGRPVDLHAADIDPAAVRCARRNVGPAGGQVHQGDLDGALPAGLRGRVGVLLANVPYVPTGDVALLPAEAREHEARLALDGGPDGLDVLRRVAAVAPAWLAPGRPPADRDQRAPGRRGHRRGGRGRPGPPAGQVGRAGRHRAHRGPLTAHWVRRTSQPVGGPRRRAGAAGDAGSGGAGREIRLGRVSRWA